MSHRLKQWLFLTAGFFLTVFAISKLSRGIWYGTNHSHSGRLPDSPLFDLSVGLILLFLAFRYWKRSDTK